METHDLGAKARGFWRQTQSLGLSRMQSLRALEEDFFALFDRGIWETAVYGAHRSTLFGVMKPDALSAECRIDHKGVLTL